MSNDLVSAKVVSPKHGGRFRASPAKSAIATMVAGTLLSAARHRRGKSALLLLAGGLALEAWLAISTFSKRNETL